MEHFFSFVIVHKLRFLAFFHVSIFELFAKTVFDKIRTWMNLVDIGYVLYQCHFNLVHPAHLSAIQYHVTSDHNTHTFKYHWITSTTSTPSRLPLQCYHARPQKPALMPLQWHNTYHCNHVTPRQQHPHTCQSYANTLTTAMSLHMSQQPWHTKVATPTHLPIQRHHT